MAPREILTTGGGGAHSERDKKNDISVSLFACRLQPCILVLSCMHADFCIYMRIMYSVGRLFTFAGVCFSACIFFIAPTMRHCLRVSPFTLRM